MSRCSLFVRTFVFMPSTFALIFILNLSGCGGGGGTSGLSTIVPGNQQNDIEKVELIAEGTGAIENKDIVTAKENAIIDALRQAVVKTAGTLISNESFTTNYNEIDEAILKKAPIYAKVKEILEEKQEENLYKVKISCFIYPSGLKKDLDYVLPPSLSPVLIVINETNFEEKAMPPYSETEMIKKFKESKFAVIEQEKITSDIRDAFATFDSMDNWGNIKSFANEVGAKVVISGDAYSEGKKEDVLPSGATTFKTFAQIQARAIDVKTGEIFAAEMQKAENIYSAQPNWIETEQTTLQNAADLLALIFIAEVKKFLLGGSSYPIHIQVTGDSKYKKYNEFKRELGNLYGFLKMDERDFDGDSGQAELSFIATQDELRDVVSKLTGRKTESGYSISVQAETMVIKSQERIRSLSVKLD